MKPPLLCHQSPNGGRGTVAIVPEQVMQRYRNAEGWVREGTGTVPS